MLGVGLVLWTLAVFWRASANGFIDYDDDITKNPHVQAGLTLPSIAWAFTTVQSANWHPLTWLSLQLDYEIHGLDAAGFHLTNVGLHAANTLLLFLALRRMTGAAWRSGVVAALFALHPLHVESVAWLAERKDVLSTLFAMLTLLAYARYRERPGLARYLFVVLAFALGLTAKPMLVTLPCVLLLLDYWPLGQIAPAGAAVGKQAGWRWLVLEKTPLLSLSAACCVVTWYAQEQDRAIRSVEVYPVAVRLANALNAYVAYIGKTLWPVDLGAYYPHPGRSLSWGAAAWSGLLLAVASGLVLRTVRKFPYLAVGWSWYLGTLVPVIGLVQVGEQAMADRYTYFPLIGLFMAATWGLADLAARWRRQSAAGAVAALALTLCSVLGWLQVPCWHDDETLWRHALAVTTSNAQAHNYLGAALGKQRRHEEAIAEFFAALRLAPGYAEAHYHLGVALAKVGRTAEAAEHYRTALQLDRSETQVHEQLGLALATLGQVDEAERHFRAALLSNPGNAVVCFNLGLLLARQQKWEEALTWLGESVRLQPDEARFHLGLAYALQQHGDQEAAEEQFRETRRLGQKKGDADQFEH
jgi:tetratricopeptide (TPR) repeat protein